MATPNSPPHEHGLHRLEDDMDEHQENGPSGSTSEGNRVRHLRESEEVERLKFETARTELLDKLNLHILINHKELAHLHRDTERISGQLRLLEVLHGDRELLDKVETWQRTELARRKRAAMLSLSFADSYSNDSSGMMPMSSGSQVSHSHPYQTRSKSNGNLVDAAAHLRPANDDIIGMRMSGAKTVPPLQSFQPDDPSLTKDGFQIRPFNPIQMYSHHRRNYSSTCLTSNSGIVGHTDDNKAIFRRYDGILVVITCKFCGRSGFTSAQGIVNHVRLKHGKSYNSQPITVLKNQELLPKEKQDATILSKFEKLGLDPQNDYLPSEIAIPNIERRDTPYSANASDLMRKSEVSEEPCTDHLAKLYKNNGESFSELIHMVKSASNDLDVVIKAEDELDRQLNDEANDGGGDNDEKEDNNDDEDADDEVNGGENKITLSTPGLLVPEIEVDGDVENSDTSGSYIPSSPPNDEASSASEEPKEPTLLRSVRDGASTEDEIIITGHNLRKRHRNSIDTEHIGRRTRRKHKAEIEELEKRSLPSVEESLKSDSTKTERRQTHYNLRDKTRNRHVHN